MKEKRFVCTGIGLILTAMLLCGILLQGKAEAEGSPSHIAVIRSDHDKTALPPFIYNPDAIDRQALLPEKTLQTGQTQPSDPETVAEQAQLVLRCRVSGVYYTFLAQQAWTQADVEVLECLKGPLDVGDMISVYFPGGYLSRADYARIGEAEKDLPDYLLLTVDRIPHPEAGEEYLLFLNAAGADTALPRGAWCLSAGPNGVLPLPRADSLYTSETIQALYEQLGPAIPA